MSYFILQSVVSILSKLNFDTETFEVVLSNSNDIVAESQTQQGTLTQVLREEVFENDDIMMVSTVNKPVKIKDHTILANLVNTVVFCYYFFRICKNVPIHFFYFIGHYHWWNWWFLQQKPTTSTFKFIDNSSNKIPRSQWILQDFRKNSEKLWENRSHRGYRFTVCFHLSLKPS